MAGEVESKSGLPDQRFNTSCGVCAKDQQVLWRLKQVESLAVESKKELDAVDDKILKVKDDFYKEISNIRSMLLVTMTSACLSLLGIIAMLILK
jgi:hypothetical protein